MRCSIPYATKMEMTNHGNEILYGSATKHTLQNTWHLLYVYIYIYIYILLFSAIDCVDALKFDLDAPTLGVSMLNANSSHRCINVCCYLLWMPPGKIQMHHCSNIHTCRQHTKDDRMFKHVPFYQHTIVWFTMHNTNSLTCRYSTHFKIHAAIAQLRTTHRTC